MPFWKRTLIIILAVLAVSFIASLIWKAIFGSLLPSYLAGVIGGLTALPLWELLKRVGPRP
jgi:NhaP-type Na+/H+ or K+/H+ antiporter